MINQINDNKLYFAKLKEGAKIPTKDTENAGYDIYSYFDVECILINPHETRMIPTGVCSACSEDYYIQLAERGSTGTKGIAQRCGVIDSGYRNEWFVPLTNTTEKKLFIVKKESLYDLKEGLHEENYVLLQNTETTVDDHYIFYPYEKAICQAIILPVPKMEVKEISARELQLIPSERGLGHLGSSNK